MEKQQQLMRAQESAAAHERRIADVQGAHKTRTPQVDWLSKAALLSPAKAFLSASQYAEHVKEHRETVEHARAILRREPAAYEKALQRKPLHDFGIHGATRAEFSLLSLEVVAARIYAQSSAVLPSETQSVTATGKLTSKAMPRATFVELYQDHICSIALRVARELHALLPLEAVLVTTFSDDGLPTMSPVLSSVIYRKQLEGLWYATLDPSDTLDSFQTRTNFKASRRSGAFQPIEPFELKDVQITSGGASLSSLIARAKVMLDELE